MAMTYKTLDRWTAEARQRKAAAALDELAGRIEAAAAMPAELQPLVDLIVSSLTPDLLHKDWVERANDPEAPPTTGHCACAAAAFWWLAGGPAYGWKMRNIPQRVWSKGPHYFVIHPATGTIVDPTADQFRGARVPYNRSEGRAPPTRGGPIPVSARLLVERVLSQPEAEAAIEQAKLWAKPDHHGDEAEAARPGHQKFKPKPPKPLKPADKPMVWFEYFKGSDMPAEIQRDAGFLLRKVQQGETIPMPKGKPVETGIFSLRLGNTDGRGGTWRVLYAPEPDAVVMLDFFLKKDEKLTELALKRARQRLKSYREA